MDNLTIASAIMPFDQKLHVAAAIGHSAPVEAQNSADNFEARKLQLAYVFTAVNIHFAAANLCSSCMFEFAMFSDRLDRGCSSSL